VVSRGFILSVLGLACLAIYLVVSAPPPLEETPAARPTIPVERLFAVLEAENDAVRELWTKEIVGAGTRAGLKFDEHWREPGLDAGPLPALFLRETARSLEKNPVQLSLFLGSDFPINDANRFEGQQLERLGELRRTGQPQFFYMTDTQLHTGMFSDVAVAEACVDCHNEHEQTPKKDWRLHDVMGATTWLYPAKAVTTEEFLAALSALHLAFEEAYRGYITKVATFGNPPPLGERWPRDGYFLPAPEVFMAEAYRRTGPQTMQALAGLTSGTTDGTARP
jgi:hypothetical protein